MLSVECVDMFYNYNNHYLSFDGGNVFLLDEVLPKIFVYDRETQSPKGGMLMRLPEFVNGPKRDISKKMPFHKFVAWEDSWSRLTGFTRVGQHFAISYEVPAESKNARGKSRRSILAKVGVEGRASWHKYFQGHVFGSHEGKVFVFRDWDEDEYENPSYFLEIYEW